MHNATLDPDDIEDAGWCSRTTPTRTAWDIAAWHDLLVAVPLLDRLLRDDLVDPSELDRLALRKDGQRGNRQARRAFALADGRAQSPPESVLRVRLTTAGLPPAIPQCPVAVLPAWSCTLISAGHSSRSRSSTTDSGTRPPTSCTGIGAGSISLPRPAGSSYMSPVNGCAVTSPACCVRSAPPSPPATGVPRSSQLPESCWVRRPRTQQVPRSCPDQAPPSQGAGAGAKARAQGRDVAGGDVAGGTWQGAGVHATVRALPL